MTLIPTQAGVQDGPFHHPRWLVDRHQGDEFGTILTFDRYKLLAARDR